MSNFNIAVIGAGAVGLTTALELQDEFNGAQVTILSEKFGKETTSFAAAGVFYFSVTLKGPTEEITELWTTKSYEYWDHLLKTEGARAGVKELPVYLFSNKSVDFVKNHHLEKNLPIYRAATEEELKLCPGDWKYGSFFNTMLTDCEWYLPWATNKFTAAGGIILQKKVESLTHLLGKYDVIVNCTGIGAKDLCNDSRLIPIRGQIVKVDAPWIKAMYANFDDNYDTFITPGLKTVTLGTTYKANSFDLNVNMDDEVGIRSKCEKLLPNLKTAPTIEQRVGLRPYRDVIRVEKEILSVKEDKLKVVHNYGHGSQGITTSAGTAKHAVMLVREILSGK